jgi:L-lactate dehydrogenase (cytochrome)
LKDRDFIERLIDRAKAANCSALMLTLDLQILGQRHKDIKNGLCRRRRSRRSPT